MCKIITLTNVSKIKDLKKLTETAASLVSESERDGFGYAIQTKQGCYGERTTSPIGFKVSLDQKMLEYDFVVPTYNRFGTKAKAMGAALFHGRTSTNSKALVNTHPIVKHDWTLIHNGVVSNHGRHYAQITDNDTEHIVEYLANEGIAGVEAHLTGYYAVSALDPLGRLHVFRDSIAPLYCAKIESLNSFIFATKADHIKRLCDALKLKHSLINPVIDNVHLIFDQGQLVELNEIQPRGRTAIESSFASLSLGHALSPVGKTSSTQYSLDESAFLDEVEHYADASYTVLDYRGDTIPWSEFKTLSADEKLVCTVIRPDGTVLDPDDRNALKLWRGA